MRGEFPAERIARRHEAPDLRRGSAQGRRGKDGLDTPSETSAHPRASLPHCRRRKAAPDARQVIRCSRCGSRTRRSSSLWPVRSAGRRPESGSGRPLLGGPAAAESVGSGCLDLPEGDRHGRRVLRKPTTDRIVGNRDSP